MKNFGAIQDPASRPDLEDFVLGTVPSPRRARRRDNARIFRLDVRQRDLPLIRGLPIGRSTTISTVALTCSRARDLHDEFAVR